jgi:predicted transcriptional regulator
MIVPDVLQQHGARHDLAGMAQQSARKSALRHLTDKLFEGSSELLMTHLVSDQKLSVEQVQRLRRILSAQRGRARR